ncbi:acyl-CoA N-acyltransferase [Amylocarpus encephaloides]|uniref:Acyl-CoA N-acyltransferase n=1 Tax=Amylocarpus encephaloides TaxID=45428 RepID=A0A9P8C5U9_9HELO|nr:acyl-CoA N-acyltransferase [Amylocarpus encephaloides]
MSTSQGISLLPCTPTDFPTLAALESVVFYHDEFSIVAFGPERASAENLAIRTQGFHKTLEPESQKSTEYFKAVNESGEIVGWSSWSFVHGGKNGEGDGVWSGKGEKLVKKDIEEDSGGWGVSANVRFCEEVFLVADEWMVESTKGEPYAKLNVLIVSPSLQRRGIGTLMLSEGLKEVDRRGLQCVLGASPEGAGLYEKIGFKEVGSMELKLWEYEGGEGMGMTRHGVMHRPAVVVK